MNRDRPVAIDFQAPQLADVVVNAREADIDQDHFPAESRGDRSLSVRVPDDDTIHVKVLQQIVDERCKALLVAAGQITIPQRSFFIGDDAAVQAREIVQLRVDLVDDSIERPIRVLLSEPAMYEQRAIDLDNGLVRAYT